MMKEWLEVSIVQLFLVGSNLTGMLTANHPSFEGIMKMAAILLKSIFAHEC